MSVSTYLPFISNLFFAFWFPFTFSPIFVSLLTPFRLFVKARLSSLSIIEPKPQKPKRPIGAKENVINFASDWLRGWHKSFWTNITEQQTGQKSVDDYYSMETRSVEREANC